MASQITHYSFEWHISLTCKFPKCYLRLETEKRSCTYVVEHLIDCSPKILFTFNPFDMVFGSLCLFKNLFMFAFDLHDKLQNSSGLGFSPLVWPFSWCCGVRFQVTVVGIGRQRQLCPKKQNRISFCVVFMFMLLCHCLQNFSVKRLYKVLCWTVKLAQGVGVHSTLSKLLRVLWGLADVSMTVLCSILLFLQNVVCFEC